jgi:hypothetical protein
MSPKRTKAGALMSRQALFCAGLNITFPLGAMHSQIAIHSYNDFMVGRWRRQGLTWGGFLASEKAKDVAVSG